MPCRVTTSGERETMRERYCAVRGLTEKLCAPLATEDFQLQSMPDCSPPKWHLAHSTWFFEQFVLATQSGYEPVNPAYQYLFNSYYEAVGDRWPRPNRGLLSRPTVGEVTDYRHAVDERMLRRLETADRATMIVVELGLNHEQQHQELLLTDIKHAFSLNPLRPIYTKEITAETQRARRMPFSASSASPRLTLNWLPHAEGVYSIGQAGPEFAYDNESPRHRVFLEAFEIADRLVSVGEYQQFIDDRGYERSEFWLSDGWTKRQAEEWQAPLYWRDGQIFTLHGERPLDPDEPVCHVSFYEADAYARWAGARLPTEAEWEVAALAKAADSENQNFLESGRLHPIGGAGQFLGDAWEWTASPYTPYPGYRPAAGALGEYNGKFMCNQMVLRGGSCVTPTGHVRPTYRNFFPPEARWQFSGIRLAKGPV
ncbi:MAG: ergothioneine biosynthesis protein EgtB [Gemmataceae bacterium]